MSNIVRQANKLSQAKAQSQFTDLSGLSKTVESISSKMRVERDIAAKQFANDIPDNFEYDLVPAELKGTLRNQMNTYKQEYLEASRKASMHANSPGSKEYQEAVQELEGVKGKMENSYNNLVTMKQHRDFELKNKNTRGYADEASASIADKMITGITGDQISFGEDGSIIVNDEDGGFDMSGYKRTSTRNSEGAGILSNITHGNAFELGKNNTPEEFFLNKTRQDLGQIRSNPSFADELFHMGVDGDTNSSTAFKNYINQINSDDNPDNDIAWDGKSPSESAQTMNLMLGFYEEIAKDSYNSGLATNKSESEFLENPNFNDQVSRSQRVIMHPKTKGKYFVKSKVNGEYYAVSDPSEYIDTEQPGMSKDELSNLFANENAATNWSELGIGGPTMDKMNRGDNTSTPEQPMNDVEPVNNNPPEVVSELGIPSYGNEANPNANPQERAQMDKAGKIAWDLENAAVKPKKLIPSESYSIDFPKDSQTSKFSTFGRKRTRFDVNNDNTSTVTTTNGQTTVISKAEYDAASYIMKSKGEDIKNAESVMEYAASLELGGTFRSELQNAMGTRITNEMMVSMQKGSYDFQNIANTHPSVDSVTKPGDTSTLPKPPVNKPTQGGTADPTQDNMADPSQSGMEPPIEASVVEEGEEIMNTMSARDIDAGVKNGSITNSYVIWLMKGMGA